MTSPRRPAGARCFLRGLVMILRCSECEEPASLPFCNRCGGLLEFVISGLRLDATGYKALLRTRRAAGGPLWSSGVWRFAELLPQIDTRHVVTLHENVVPLYEARGGRTFAGVDRLRYLHLGMNPTGSLKDPGMTVAISAAKAEGARRAVCASTGNTAASLAAYAARAGMEAVVVVPAGAVSEAKLLQTLSYGARVIAIDGDFDSALAVVRTIDDPQVAVVNSINPYRIEGQKCAAFVLLESLDWEPPEWIVVPGGNLGNASAFGKGMREAFELALITRLPRLAVIQAERAAPFVRAFEDRTELRPVNARTEASAIRIGAPASWRKALRELERTNGTACSVSDDEIAAAYSAVAREGIGAEPASCAALAGVRKLCERGTIARGESVVVVLTGHILKDPAYALQRLRAASRTIANVRDGKELLDALAVERHAAAI